MLSLSKFTASASKLAKQAIASVLETVAAPNTPSLSSSSSLMTEGEAAREELQRLFESVVQAIVALQRERERDIHSHTHTPSPFETDARLQVGHELKRIVFLLQRDSLQWLAVQRRVDQLRKHRNNNNDTFNSDNNTNHAQESALLVLEESDIPCIDYFLQCSAVQTLCNLAYNDVPRGVMPLALKFLALLLRTVQYPLLPHQSIHKPIAKLISIATRYDVFVGLQGDEPRTDEEREKYAHYRKRINITLTGLIKVLWRKIHENPPVLDYFILSDKRSQRIGIEHGLEPYRSPRAVHTRTTPSHNTAAPVRTQIDIFQALLPLLFEARLSHHTQETLLLALYVPDTRIPQFVTEHTTLPDLLSQKLSESFTDALKALHDVLCVAPLSLLPQHLLALGDFSQTTSVALKHTQTPHKLSTQHTQHAASSLRTPVKTPYKPLTVTQAQQTPLTQSQTDTQSTQAQETLTVALRRFTECVRLVCAVYEVCSQKERDSVCVSECDNVSVCAQLSQAYNTLFVQQTLRRCVSLCAARSSERESAAVYTLLRLLLSLLHTHSQPVGETPTQRSHTPSHTLAQTEKSPSLSQKLSVTLSVSTHTASHKGTRTHTDSPSLLALTTQCILFAPETDEKHGKSDKLANISSFYWSLVDRTGAQCKSLSVSALLLLQHLLGSAPPHVSEHLLFHATPPQTSLDLLLSSPTPSSPSSHSKQANAQTPSTPQISRARLSLTLSLSLDESLAQTAQAIERERQRERQHLLLCSAQRLQRYTCVSVDLLLRRLLSVPHHTHTDTQPHTTVLLPHTPHTPVAHSTTHTPGHIHSEEVFSRILRRLSLFLSLRTDEQLALSALLREVLLSLALTLCVAPSSGTDTPSAPHTPLTPHTKDSSTSHTLFPQHARTHAEGEEALSRLLSVLRTLSALHTQLATHTHLRTVSDAPRKLQLVSEYLLGSHMLTQPHLVADPLSQTHAHRENETVRERASEKERERERLLSSESLTTRRALTSAVLLRETHAEAQAILFAVTTVRRSLSHTHTQSLSLTNILSLETQDGERDTVCCVSALRCEADREEIEERERELEEVREIARRLRGEKKRREEKDSLITENEDKGDEDSLLDIERCREDFQRDFAELERFLETIMHGESP